MEITTYATLAALATALVAVLLTGLRPRLDVVAVLLWAGVVVVGTIAATVLGMRLLDLHEFGVANVVYRQLVVGLPVAGILLGIRTMRRGWRTSSSVAARVVLAGALTIGALGIYASAIEPNRLVVHQATLAVPGVAAGEQVRVGVLSDLQIGRTGPGPHEQAAIEALMAQQPDVILFAGDVAQITDHQFAEQLPALRRLLAGLHAPGGVFVVQGDVDSRADLTALTQGTDLRWLSDEVVTTHVGGTTVAIGGIDLEPTAPGAARTADALEARPGSKEVRILLAHRPDVVELLPARGTRTDLVVAGHTHGGQVVVPFFGPPMTLTAVPRTVAAGGLHRMDDRTIWVSTGIGVERFQAPKLRFLDPPSVGIITLTAD